MVRRGGRRNRTRGPGRGGSRTQRTLGRLPISVSWLLIVGIPLLFVGSITGAHVLGITDTADGPQPSGLNVSLAEQLVHDEVNDVRREHGLSALQYDDGFATDARGHSRDMAQRDYFSHTTPAGTGIRSRYGGGCGTVGENIAQTWWRTNIEGEGRLGSESELAASVVDSWMDSPGHRENILRAGWRSEGIGIAMDGDKVYVTQGFCGA